MTAGKVSRNTHSVGISTRQVTISAITPDGSTAVCIDKTGVEVRVPMYWQAAKGQPPAVGENWILSQDLGQWAFSMIVASSNAPFSTWSGSQVTVTGAQASSHVLTVQNTHAGTTSAAEMILMAAATDPAFGIQLATDTNRRLGSNASGKLQWSSGTASADAFLERVAAAVLKLTGSLQITGSLYLDANWTTVSTGFPTGWSGTFSYRLLAKNLMIVSFSFGLVPGTAGTPDPTTLLTLPTGYFSALAPKNIPAATDALKVNGSFFESARIRIDTSGIVSSFGLAQGAGGASFSFGCGLVPLDI